MEILEMHIMLLVFTIILHALVWLGIPASICYVLAIRPGRTRSHALANLEQRGFKVDYKLIAGKGMGAVFDVIARKAAFVDKGKVQEYSFSQIRSWQTIRILRNGVQSAELHIALADPANPLVKLFVSADEADAWSARLSALING